MHFRLLVLVSDSTEESSQVDMMIGGKGREKRLREKSFGPTLGKFDADLFYLMYTYFYLKSKISRIK